MSDKLWLRNFVPLESNVFRRADGTTARTWNIPGQWLNSNVVFGSDRGGVYLVFGWNSTVAANAAAFSGITPGPPDTLLPVADSPVWIPANEERLFYIPESIRQGVPDRTGASSTGQQVRYFGIVGAIAASQWYAYAVTEKPGLVR